MARRLHITRVGRHKVVGGLAWRDTPGDTPQEVRDQIRGAAEAFRSRYGLLLESSRTEVGFVPEIAQKDGTGAYSAAAWLAHAHGEPLLFIKALPNGQYWIVHTDAGYVDPRTDEVCGEEEARVLVDAILDSLAIAADPVSVVIDGDRKPSAVMLDRINTLTDRSLESLLEGTSPPAQARIRQMVGVTPGTLAAVFALLLLAGAGYGVYVMWHKYQREREFERQRAELAQRDADAARLENEAQLRMKLAVDQAAASDTNTPPPDLIVTRCADRVQALGANVGGWKVLDAECDVTGASLSVRVQQPTQENSPGTAGSLMAVAEQRGFAVSVQPAQGQATLSLSLPAPAPREALKPSQFAPFNDVLRSLMSRLQLAKQAAVGLTYVVNAPAPKVVLYLDPRNEGKQGAERFTPVPAERTYLQGVVSIDGRNRSLLDSFSLDYPILTITKATYTPTDQGLAWHLEANYVTAR